MTGPTPTEVQNIGSVSASEIPQVPSKTSFNGLSAHDARTMADWNVELGVMTRDESRKALEESGYDPGPLIATDGIAAEIDQAFPPALASEYSFDRYLIGEVTKADADSEMAWRKTLSHARFPVAAGNILTDRLHEVAKKYPTMSDPEYASLQSQSRFYLKQKWGENFDQNVALTQKLISEIATQHPGFGEAIDAGGGDDPRVILTIFHQAQILLARNYGRDTKFTGQKLIK